MMNVHADKIIANKFIGEFENSNNNDGISIGMIIPYSGNNEIPSGFLLCNGASIRKDTYIDLFNIIGTTYGSIDEDHFNLPNLTGKFLEGNDTSGEYKEAGLPNITGQTGALLGNRALESTEYNGALKISRLKISQGYSGSSADEHHSIEFDASQSNQIYGNSNTVQPNSLTIRYIIKAFNGINISSSELEVTQLANDLADKANRDLSNLTDVGKKTLGSTVVEFVVNEDSSWYRKYSDGWVEQGGTIIPSNLSVLLSFNKPFATTAYTFLLSQGGNDNDNDSNSNIVRYDTRTSTNIQLYLYTKGLQQWCACGMGVEE